MPLTRYEQVVGPDPKVIAGGRTMPEILSNGRTEMMRRGGGILCIWSLDGEIIERVEEIGADGSFSVRPPTEEDYQ